MAIIEFPPIENATEDGLLAIGGDLEVSSLLLAYGQGIFPWPIDENYPLAWFSPDPRGIFFTDEIHISKSMKKFLRKFQKNSQGKITFNQNFSRVIEECAKVPRKGQDSTWITNEMVQAYKKLHQAGFAYSSEVWIEDRLVGGIYGVCLGKYFCGESMFFKEDNCSKLVLINLLQHLRKKGVKWFDTQMVTPATANLGAKEIPRSTFLSMLKSSLKGTNLKPNLDSFFKQTSSY